jgi:predicted Zn-dependent protease
MHERLGSPEEARRTLAQARKKFGEKIGVLLLQAEFERRQGNVAQAAELYDEVLKLDPAAVPVVLRKAAVEMGAGQFEEAARSYEAVLGMAPNQPDALNDLAYLYTDVLKRPADSLALLNRVDPEVLSRSAPIRDTLGWTQLKVGDAVAAVATLQKVVDELPSNGTVRYHLGAALVAAGRPQDGRRELQAAIGLGISPAEEEAAHGLLGDADKAP